MAKDHQDGGFAADLRRILSRRAALTAVATAGAGVAAWWILAGSPGGAEANTTTLAMDGSTCTLLPQETAGPFPADGSNALAGQRLNVLAVSGVERRDIRQSFGGLTEDADGILLELEITLVDIDAACAPLSDLAVYIWHCDSAGKYSLYEMTESNALRAAMPMAWCGLPPCCRGPMQGAGRISTSRFLQVLPRLFRAARRC